MINHNADKADEEIANFVEDIQKKYGVSYETMVFILTNLTDCYKVKVIAEEELDES